MAKPRHQLQPSGELVQRVRSEVDDLILYFSCGKDSIAMWLWLKQFDFNIHPVFLYMVPDLRSDQENLAYYEHFFGQRIMRFPHPLFYKMLNDLVYQPPERCAQILAFDLPYFDFGDLDQVIANGYLGGRPYYAAMGMRINDNLDRRMMMYKNGVLGSKGRRFYYPIWDWPMAQLGEVINNSGVKLPRAYEFSGRTVAAIDYYYMKPFRDAYPDDFLKILEWFPLLEAEFYRYERMSNG
jgi:hypothetical protein